MVKTVFVAMSGGVDSSVTAALMKKAGFNVVGVFMKPPSFTALRSSSLRSTSAESYGGHSGLCNWKEEREYALRVGAKLGIPLLTWDFSKEYEKYVIEYMIEGYRQGRTPNPDVMCNKFIKFGLFLDKALKIGADFIATGHYVRKAGNKLLKAKDLSKDQSYFLYTLNQEQLRHCLFPIGDYPKDEVRKRAKKFGLPNWDKKDSQGVCFVGPLEVKEFLKKYIQPQKGLVLRKSYGKILGEHDGAWFYTIGQRHGFSLNGGQPYYIVDKDIQKNILYVDKEVISNKLLVEGSRVKPGIAVEVKIKDFNWINGGRKVPLNCQVKTRYRQKDLDCTIVTNGSDKALVKMKENNVPVAPGQAAVFYKRGEVLGGGIIS